MTIKNEIVNPLASSGSFKAKNADTKYAALGSQFAPKQIPMTFGNLSSRPSFESIYMELAESLAGRSSCCRLQVGTVITSTDFRKVLSVGYNGNASGLPNTCDSPDKSGACGCIHSECNAIINCDTPGDVDKFVFVTHLPCVMCAKCLINLKNVKKVFYRNDYRIRDSIALFEAVGIALEHMPSTSL